MRYVLLIHYVMFVKTEKRPGILWDTDIHKYALPLWKGFSVNGPLGENNVV